MPNLTITATEVSAIVSAKYASDPKSAKKAAWGAIRSKYGTLIPMGAKLGVETDPNQPHYAELYVKDSNPRQYLPASHALLQGQASTQAPQFVAVDSQDASDWYCIEKHDLLTLLRDDEDFVEQANVLPSNFPATTSADAVVLDSKTGKLYFRG